MSACERCWSDARRAAVFGDVAAEYRRLLEERRDRPCSPEEQAGLGTSDCPACGRRTRHQFTGECMACGSKEER